MKIDPRNDELEENEEPLSFFQVMFSIFAAAFGVQNRPNSKRDFARGKVVHFIISGILFTVVFVALVLVLVNTVLTNVA